MLKQVQHDTSFNAFVLLPRQINISMILRCHSGLDPESRIITYRFPLEFTPYLIRGGNDILCCLIAGVLVKNCLSQSLCIKLKNYFIKIIIYTIILTNLINFFSPHKTCSLSSPETNLLTNKNFPLLGFFSNYLTMVLCF